MNSNKVIQIVGYKKNTGKTTLVSRLISVLKRKGMCVGTVKHDGHSFEIDHPDSDTWKHREAGADLVGITSKHGLTAFVEQRAYSLEDMLARMEAADVVLVEGFKQEAYPKLLMVRTAEDLLLLHSVRNIKAVVSWIDLDSLPSEQTLEVPWFGVDEIDRIAEYMEKSSFALSRQVMAKRQRGLTTGRAEPQRAQG